METNINYSAALTNTSSPEYEKASQEVLELFKPGLENVEDNMTLDSLTVVFAEVTTTSSTDRKRRFVMRNRRSSTAEATVIAIYIVTVPADADVNDSIQDSIAESIKQFVQE